MSCANGPHFDDELVLPDEKDVQELLDEDDNGDLELEQVLQLIPDNVPNCNKVLINFCYKELISLKFHC